MVLQVANLNKSFRHPWNLTQIQVLFDVNFSIEKPSLVGFLGANGAGKTTSMKCLLGLLRYQSGDLKIFGEDHLSPSVKQKIGYLPERPFFYQYLTGREFLFFYGELSGKTKKELAPRVEDLLERVGLGHAGDLYLHQYSKGMLQRVGLAQALVHRPQLLILDEPLSGLDPDGRRQLTQIIQQAHEEEGTSVFFSSHLLDDVDRLCKDLVVIQQGRIKYSGTKESFVQSSERGFVIRYHQGGQEKQVRVDNLGGVQSQIDQLRQSGDAIMSIEEEKLSLDEAFKRLQNQEAQS